MSVQVYPGNTGDPKTVPDQARKLRESFGLDWVVPVGDRGMLTGAQIDEIRGERLVACFNPFLAEDRTRARNELPDATEASLAKLQKFAAKRTKEAGSPASEKARGCKRKRDLRTQPAVLSRQGRLNEVRCLR